MKKEKNNLLPISEFLFKIDIHPNKISKGNKEYWYNSPLNPSGDSSPSFKVDNYKNVWFDHSQGIGGGIIDLIVQLKNVSEHEASRIATNAIPVGDRAKMVEVFNDIKTRTIRKGESIRSTQNKYISDKSILSNNMAIKYLKSRGINPNTASNFIHLVLYSKDGKLSKQNKPFFSLGWKTVKGGWELTSMSHEKRYKSTIGSKEITYIRSNKKEVCKEVTIFESMFDYLSIHNYPNKSEEVNKTDVIILNTTAVFENYLERLTNHYHTFYCYTDNDQAGDEVVQVLKSKIETKRIQVIDSRVFFQGFKDLNEKVKRHQAERGIIDQHTLRYNGSFEDSIFKALVLYTKSTSVHMTDENAGKYWFSLDTKEEREKTQKKLKFTETKDELISKYTGFKIMYEAIMKQKSEGVIKSVSFYFNQTEKGIDNQILA